MQNNHQNVWAKETEGPVCFVFFPFACLLRSNLTRFLVIDRM